jgi:ABC-type dipeptide/oligopeptide/nickel transport system permease subunit
MLLCWGAARPAEEKRLLFPLPSWGTMPVESQQYCYIAWWLPEIPGMAITLLVMASNLTGDWPRDRTDLPRRQI